MAVVNRRLWNRMGASGLQRSICGAAAGAAVLATYVFGALDACRDIMMSARRINFSQLACPSAATASPSVEPGA
jgi:hypothetical protein